MANSTRKSVRRLDRAFLVGLTIWILAQLIRLIAIPLISSVASGVDAPGWMYPAILDVLTAVLAPLLVLAIWRRRSFMVWTFTVIYLTISLVDHVGAFTNLALIGEPLALKAFSGGNSPYLAPTVQTTFDIIFFYLLMLPRFRRIFFKLWKPA